MALENLFLGIEIGGTKLQIAIGDEHGQLLDKKRFNVEKKLGAQGILAQIEAVVKILPLQSRAAGIGFRGPVDWQTGRTAVSHQIEGWAAVQLGEWLENLIHAPVYVDNDANVAALGEAKFGAGREYNPVFYITLGSGVGGGLVVDNQIYHGSTPGEAEIGHLRLDRSGTTVESRCAGWAVDKRIREVAALHPNSTLAQLISKTSAGEARFLGAALAAGDPLAQQIVDETTEDLALGLSHAVHLFHPAVIILGGGLSLLGEPLRLALVKKLPLYLMQAFQPGPTIRLAQLGEDTVPLGALALAQYRYLNRII